VAARLQRLRKKLKIVIPRAGFCPRNLLFSIAPPESKSLALLGMTKDEDGANRAIAELGTKPDI
jgi:hypothetical protein